MINAWCIEWKTNECGVNICHIFCNEEEMGHVYSTMHPTIPYEVYWDNSKKVATCYEYKRGRKNNKCFYLSNI